MDIEGVCYDLLEMLPVAATFFEQHNSRIHMVHVTHVLAASSYCPINRVVTAHTHTHRQNQYHAQQHSLPFDMISC